jgi:prepilin-type N-terminal cleavage/methylation domain-containing protein
MSAPPTPPRRVRVGSEEGFTLIELVIVCVIVAILLSILLVSYVGYRDKANDAKAGADVRIVLPSVEAFHGDNDTYVGMTPAGLKAAYDTSIDPATYTITSLSATGYCVASARGGRSWRKDGPGQPIAPGTCP